MKKKNALVAINDNEMYDVNDIITNFHLFGGEMTFKETTEFFNNAQVISKESIDSFIRENPKSIGEINLEIMMDDIAERIMTHNYDPFDKEEKEPAPEKLLELVENVIKRRVVDYNYFVEYVKRLRQKGLTYLAILQFVANSKEQDESYWEGLLAELDINYNGKEMQGSDIKRILTALFNSQTRLQDKLAEANDLRTYEEAYLSEYAKIGARSGSDEMYPSSNILSKMLFFDYSMRDNTSIAMTKGQIEELKKDKEEEQGPFIKELVNFIIGLK